jgi:putative DNA primase/helicase
MRGDGETPPGADKVDFDDPESAIAYLATLDNLTYQLVRDASARRLKIRVGELDKEVAKLRPQEADEKPRQGHKFEFPVIEPWPDPVDGGELLKDIEKFFETHAFLPDKGASARVIALWVMHTYCFVLFDHTPRLHIKSPTKRSGKTTVMKLLALVTCRAFLTAHATPAAVFRLIEMEKLLTLLMDEADTYLMQDVNLRRVFNAGHEPTGKVVLTVGDDHEPRAFTVFAPVVIASIGNIPDTNSDRSIVINMKRATKSELARLARINKATRKTAGEIAQRAVRWCEDHEAEMAEADPIMTDELYARMGDNWRPLLAIADAAGGDWPKLVREAANAFMPVDDDAEAYGVQLLADIRVIVKEFKKDGVITSESLVEELVKLEGRPWAEYGKAQKPITKNRVARMLKEFKIYPEPVGSATYRRSGYVVERFADAFSRNLPAEDA